jgi:hypothetical protein
VRGARSSVKATQQVPALIIIAACPLSSAGDVLEGGGGGGVPSRGAGAARREERKTEARHGQRRSLGRERDEGGGHPRGR